MAKDRAIKRVLPPQDIAGRTIDDFCRAHKLKPEAVGMREKIRLEENGYLVRSSRYKDNPWVIPTKCDGKALKLIQGGFFSRLFGGGKKTQAYAAPQKPKAQTSEVDSTSAPSEENVPLESRVTPKSTPAVGSATTPAPAVPSSGIPLAGGPEASRGSYEDHEPAGSATGPAFAGTGQWQVPTPPICAPTYQATKVCTYKTHPELAKVADINFKVDADGKVTGKEIIDLLRERYNAEPGVLEGLVGKDLFQSMSYEIFGNARVPAKKAVDYVNDFGDKYSFEYSGPSLEELSAGGAPEVGAGSASGQTGRYIAFGDEMERVFVRVKKGKIVEIRDSYIGNRGFERRADGIYVDQNVTPKVLSKVLGMDPTEVVDKLRRLGIE